MATEATSDRAYRALSEIRSRIPQLREALIPGRRGSTYTSLTERALAAMDQLVRAERAERVSNAARGIKPAAESPAPLVLSVLDTERHIIASLARLELEVCGWLGLTPRAGAEPSARIGRLIGLLGRLEAHEPWIEHVADESGRLARRAARAVGDDERRVIHVAGRCPLCLARSLRAVVETETVFCANTDCPCAPAGCICSGTGRHVWRHDDEALACLRESA